MTDPVVTRRSLRPVRNLTSTTWWIDAGKRGAYTALALLLPLAAQLVEGDVDLTFVLGVVGLGLVASLATSLAGIPEVDGRTVPAWLAVLTRVAKTVGQTLAAALVGSQLIQDVPWEVVWTTVAGAALTTLVRALMSYLPETTLPATVEAVEVQLVPAIAGTEALVLTEHEASLVRSLRTDTGPVSD